MRKAMLLLAVFGLAGSLWAADPFTGTWKFNAAKSRFSAGIEPAPRREQIVILRETGGNHEGSSQGTNTDGSVFSDKWTVPLQGGIVKYQQGGPAAGSYYVVTLVDAGDVYWTLLKDGKQVELNHYVVSKDGKTCTGTFKGINSKGEPYEGLWVVDRQ
jgi:hypothetical protein